MTGVYRRRGCSLADALNFYSSPEPMSGCFLWYGNTNWNGYPVLHWDGKARLAHRLAYENATGHPAGNLLVCHKCDTRCCVNPDHLFLGTASDNMQDMYRKGRANGPVGETHGMAILTEDQVEAILSSYVPRHRQFGTHAMARKYGVHQTTISKITAGKNWKKFRLKSDVRRHDGIVAYEGV